ncbi:hypothetical protein F4810DRAFT_694891 [Camillea tinctor]|nr:hypothetical protein F4810DRAFT_694891 [Camillea tinctor]
MKMICFRFFFFVLQFTSSAMRVRTVALRPHMHDLLTYIRSIMHRIASHPGLFFCFCFRCILVYLVSPPPSYSYYSYPLYYIPNDMMEYTNI